MNPETAPQVPAPQPTVTPPSSPDNKPVVFIVIIIMLIFLGAFYYFLVSRERNQFRVTPGGSSQNNSQTQVTVSPTLTPTVTVMNSSDTQLDRDIQAINDKVSGLATDVNNVDQGLNDKPIDTGQ